MKNTFIKGVALVAMASFIFFSCSSDNDVQSSSSVKNNSSVLMRGSGGVYEGFEELMADLYSDHQNVEEAVEYRADGVTYLVSEVTVESDLQGYFLENAITKEVVYLSEDADKGILNHFSLVRGSVNKQVFDLTQDPNYATDGFSPKTPRDVTVQKFWGWGAPHLQDGPCENGVRPWVQSHYTFWIADGGTRPVLGLDGQPMYAPCE
ncbi:hypothetical protein [Flavobacterium pedocola]